MLKDPLLEGKILVVDGLDECITQLKRYLDFISNPTPSCRAKWIISSRNWSTIEQALRDTTRMLILHLELNRDCIAGAVRTYIQHQVDRLTSSKRYGDQLLREVHDYLTTNANDTLDKLKEFPPGLDAVYYRMTANVLECNDATICKDILAALCTVRRSATLKELAALVQSLGKYSDNPQTMQVIIGNCGSFLTLHNGTVSFVHQSAKAFLLDKACDKILPSGPEQGHYTIFKRSLEILETTLRRDIYSLRDPEFSIDEVARPDPDPLARARYSCIYWLDHLRHSGLTAGNSQNNRKEVFVALHTFLETRFLYWLEALSLLRSIRMGIVAMINLRDFVKSLDVILPQGSKEAGLSDLIHDGWRFTLHHKTAIEVAPLQVYAKLVFTPTRSLIRKAFSGEVPKWITSKPVVGKNWTPCLQTLEAHTGGVLSVTISGDGKRLASLSRWGENKIWDLETGSCLKTIKDRNGTTVFTITFMKDSQRLVSGAGFAQPVPHGSTETIKVWNIETGRCHRTFACYDSFHSISIAPDDQRFASASGSEIKIWDFESGSCLHSLEGHDDDVFMVTFSANGKWLASTSGDETIRIWDPKEGICLQTLEASHREVFRSIAFTEDGEKLASASSDGSIYIWDTQSGDCLRTFKCVSVSIAFTKNDRYLAAATFEGTCKIWDTETGACLRSYLGHSGQVVSVAFTKDARRVVSASADEAICIWDFESDMGFQEPKDHKAEVDYVAFAMDGK
ncbi:hypothetical protein QQX98_003582 [Neonectria punicea]|uniref:NACHT domain-containing protein n=1 Tax=Neonectria punicea TaxID=979145 RepID=A0ABR1HD54_9HYPO